MDNLLQFITIKIVSYTNQCYNVKETMVHILKTMLLCNLMDLKRSNVNQFVKTILKMNGLVIVEFLKMKRINNILKNLIFKL